MPQALGYFDASPHLYCAASPHLYCVATPLSLLFFPLLYRKPNAFFPCFFSLLILECPLQTNLYFPSSSFFKSDLAFPFAPNYFSLNVSRPQNSIICDELIELKINKKVFVSNRYISVTNKKKIVSDVYVSVTNKNYLCLIGTFAWRIKNYLCRIHFRHRIHHKRHVFL